MKQTDKINFMLHLDRELIKKIKHEAIKLDKTYSGLVEYIVIEYLKTKG